MKGQKIIIDAGAPFFSSPDDKRPGGKTNKRMTVEVQDTANGYVSVLRPDGRIAWIPTSAVRVQMPPTPEGFTDKIMGELAGEDLSENPFARIVEAVAPSSGNGLVDLQKRAFSSMAQATGNEQARTLAEATEAWGERNAAARKAEADGR